MCSRITQKNYNRFHSNLSLEPILNQKDRVCTSHCPFQITLILFSVRGCKSPRRQDAMATKFNALNCDIFWVPRMGLFHVTFVTLEFLGSCLVF
jgi:hypothetical protein